jgi:HlyD family secretion protein
MVWHGYAEADYVYVAPAGAGTLEEIFVRAGDAVTAGAPLFRLDRRMEEASLAASRARLAAARAKLENARTGRRSEELAVTESALERARADLDLAQQNFDRTEQLFGQGVVARARLDQDRTTLAAATSAVQELEAQLAVGRLPARPAELDAAEAEVAAAEADVRRLEAVLADRTGRAPVGGFVENVYYAVGEQAAPAAPIVSIRPEGGLEIRLFVAESALAGLQPGTRISVACRGCPDNLGAEVFWVSSEAQFNPPVIYSRADRADLVFMVKARPDSGAPLLPGQPVEARPIAP